MESVPVKAYATGEQAYAAFPHIRQVIYPESMLKKNNTEAAPGAKVFYLWNKYAQEVCKEAANNIAGIVSMYPWIFEKLPEKCCQHCAHYEPYYTRRDDSAACDARFTIAQEGRCRQSRNAKGKGAKAKSCCDRFQKR